MTHLTTLFEHTVARKRPGLLALAQRRLHDPDDAADVVQVALAKAWRALPRYRGDAGLSTWLTRIVLNCCHDFLRDHDRHPDTYPLDDLDLDCRCPDGAPGPAQLAVTRDTETRVAAAVEHAVVTAVAPALRRGGAAAILPRLHLPGGRRSAGCLRGNGAAAHLPRPARTGGPAGGLQRGE